MSGIVSKSPDMNSGIVGGYPAGHVIQTVVNTTNTRTYFGVGAGTVTLMTDFVIDITPVFSNSKIFITFNCGGILTGNVGEITTRVTGTTTATVHQQQRYGQETASADEQRSSLFMITAYDTPGTVLTQTYQLYLSSQSDVSTANAMINGNSTNNGGTIIAVEVKV